MTPEGRVKALVNRALKKKFPLLWKYMPVPHKFSIATLDYLMCVNGTFVAIETKRPGGKLTERQIQTCEDLRKAGAFVFVIDGKTSLRDALKIIEVIYYDGGVRLREKQSADSAGFRSASASVPRYTGL